MLDVLLYIVGKPSLRPVGLEDMSADLCAQLLMGQEFLVINAHKLVTKFYQSQQDNYISLASPQS